VDVVLVGFIAGLTFGGWRTGFVHRVAGLAFAVFSFVAAAYVRVPLGDLVRIVFPNVPPDYATLVGYAFGFPIILIILHVLAYPFLRDHHMPRLGVDLDRALGAVFGFLEGILILSALVVIVDVYYGSGASSAHGVLDGIISSFNSSYTVQLLRQTTVPMVLAVLGPLLPRDIRNFLPTGLPGFPRLP